MKTIGARTFKRCSGTTSGYGRYVRSIGESRGGRKILLHLLLVVNPLLPLIELPLRSQETLLSPYAQVQSGRILRV